MEKLKSQSNERPNTIVHDCVLLDINLNVIEKEDADGHKIYEYDTYRFAKGEVENDIVAMIRTKYSLNDELAILRQRDTKIEDFNAYNSFVEECKQIVKEAN